MRPTRNRHKKRPRLTASAVSACKRVAHQHSPLSSLPTSYPYHPRPTQRHAQALATTHVRCAHRHVIEHVRAHCVARARCARRPPPLQPPLPPLPLPAAAAAASHLEIVLVRREESPSPRVGVLLFGPFLPGARGGPAPPAQRRSLRR